MHEIIEQIVKENGPLSKYIPGYKVRPSQIEGMKAILDSLVSKKTFILEGPCGYGKSATYLIPTILYVILSKKRAVISTGGITLQEQIFYKDLPNIIEAIKDITGKTVSYAHIKGRNNFICKRKVDEIDTEIRKGNFNPDQEMRDLIEWAILSDTGDSSDLDYIPSYNLWLQVSCTDSSDCQGKDCKFLNRCFHQTVKNRARSADLIVCNYHLLFSDIQAGNKIIGKYDILVCDEAHEMAKVARDFMEIKVSYYTFVDIQRKITFLSNKYKHLFDPFACNISNLVEEARKYFEFITRSFSFNNDDNTKIIPRGIKIDCSIKEIIDKFGDEVYSYREDICPHGFEKKIQHKNNGEDLLSIIKNLDSIYEKCGEINYYLRLICNQDDEKMSFWFEKEKNGLHSFHAKPVKVDEFLNSTIFGNKEITSIITSATLSAGKSFEYIKNELGIKEANEMIAPSPFNLKEQQLWYLPIDAVEGNKQEFTDKMTHNLIDIINATNGGALCLFTSNYNMNLAAKKIRGILNVRLLKQGDKPRNLLLEEFIEDEDSVLLATKSFFKGVDVVGKSLRCLVIDKLPFESPSDPIMAILSNETGGFFKYFLPDMIINLKQAIGRGIRSSEDKCVIAILDNRLSTARYKMRIFNSFNYEKTATRNIEDVKKFIEDYVGA